MDRCQNRLHGRSSSPFDSTTDGIETCMCMDRMFLNTLLHICAAHLLHARRQEM